jgi:hypothetical protein
MKRKELKDWGPSRNSKLNCFTKPNASAFSIAVIIMVLFSMCSSNVKKIEAVNMPLEAPFEFFDQINEKEFKLADLNYRLNDAIGKNKTELVTQLNQKFAKSHEACIQKLEQKYPAGTVQLPFKQLGKQDKVRVKSAYISGFAFPWSTATSICFYVSIDYEIMNRDMWFTALSLTFIDNENDVIYLCNLPLNLESNTERFIVKAQPNFRAFSNLEIN